MPLGTYALSYFDQRVSVFLLGVIVLFYALNSLFSLASPQLKHPAWVYFFGGIAGFLGGAFNASGPPVVIYVNSLDWNPQEFKGNLQAYALVNGIGISISHYFAGNITAAVLNNFWSTIPAIFIGVIAGISMDRLLHPARFKKVVLYLLILLALRMIF